MPSVCFYFQVHQPNRLKKNTFFDVGTVDNVFDDSLNQQVLNKVADKCYLPANAVLKRLIERFPNQFKFSFSISGVLIDQLEKWRPDVLASFQELVATGQVELLNETFYHSLSSVNDTDEFVSQLANHKALMERVFNYTPVAFRNTELIYTNKVAAQVEKLGFKTMLGEGIDRTLNGTHPNQVLKATGTNELKVLCRNFKLSDDIAFRFSNISSPDYPLTPLKFMNWIKGQGAGNDVINLFMDYETFGEHQWADTGIFDFLENFPAEVLSHEAWDFKTITEAANTYSATKHYSSVGVTSWADTERDLSAWAGNGLQKQAIDAVYKLKEAVLATQNDALIHEWRNLQVSDHFYYMSTKHLNDGAVHSYFSSFDSPYEAYMCYMNSLANFEVKLKR
jgi:alpha-amylase